MEPMAFDWWREGLRVLWARLATRPASMKPRALSQPPGLVPEGPAVTGNAFPSQAALDP